MLKVDKVHPGDCLDMLAEVDSGSVQLCYADPPFATGRDFYLWRTDTLAYSDPFTVPELVAYLEPRAKEIRRVLSKSGVFFLHGNLRNMAYVQVACDQIFGEDNLLNAIIWKRVGSHSVSKGFDNVLDAILVYAKDAGQVELNDVLRARKITFPGVEKETGRRFAHYPVEGGSNFRFSGEERTFYKPDGTPVVIKTGIGWKWSQKTINKRWEENPNLFYFTASEHVRYKRYEDEDEGMRINNLWDDIPFITSTSSEGTGYPTQKPKLLIERIIKLGSKINDTVLDPFCGSGTTLVVAKETGRHYLGADTSPVAVTIANDRLKNVKQQARLF